MARRHMAMFENVRASIIKTKDPTMHNKKKTFRDGRSQGRLQGCVRAPTIYVRFGHDCHRRGQVYKHNSSGLASALNLC